MYDSSKGNQKISGLRNKNGPIFLFDQQHLSKPRFFNVASPVYSNGFLCSARISDGIFQFFL